MTAVKRHKFRQRAAEKSKLHQVTIEKKVNLDKKSRKNTHPFKEPLKEKREIQGLEKKTIVVT